MTPRAALFALLAIGTLALCPAVGLGAASAPVAPVTPAANAVTTLRLCFEDLDIPPWRFRDQTGHNFRLLDAVAAAVGVRFHYVAMPWRRCQSELARGAIDGGFAFSHTPERVGMGVYPPGHQPTMGPGSTYRLFTDGYVLVRRRGDRVRPEDGRIVGLRGSVGAQAGYSIVDDLKRKGVRVDEGSRDPWALLRKLAEGRVGAAALGSNKLRALQATGNPIFQGLEVVPTPLVEKDYFLVLSNDLVASRPELADAIWREIAERRDATPLSAPGDGARGSPSPD